MKTTEGQDYLWRLTIRSEDECDIKYEEFFQGSESQARRQLAKLWGNTSYMPRARHNRVVYGSREVWDQDKKRYIMVKEFKRRLRDDAKAPNGRVRPINGRV